MEGRQQKLYYFFLFAIAMASIVLLSTVFKPNEKKASEGGDQKAAATAGKAGEKAAGKAGEKAAGKAGEKADGGTPAGKPGEGEAKEGGGEAVEGEPTEKEAAAPEDEKKESIDPAERRRRARERLAGQKTALIETDSYRAKISDLNAGLVSFQIKGERYRDKENKPVDIVTTDKELFYPLAMELRDARSGETALGEEPVWEIQQFSKRALRLGLDAGGIGIGRKFEAGEGPYQLWVTTTVTNRGGEPRRLSHGIAVYHYVERDREKTPVPIFAVPSPEVSHGLCYFRTPDKGAEQPGETSLERVKREDLLEPQSFVGKVRFAGVENTYFLDAIATHPLKGQPVVESCRLGTVDYVRMPGGVVRRFHTKTEAGEAIGSLFTVRLVYPEIALGPGESRTFRAMAYLGPKMPEDLAAAGHGLSKAIDFGFFAVLSQALSWLLRAIHGGVGNWGVAIILLTFLVKAVLYPLTAKSLHSMARMKMLKPEMDKVNELYKDDREKKSAALMELYRKHGINPLGGCLPQLLQLPIWIALYTSLRTNVELYHAPFTLWWTDLSSPDPFFVLPLALGALMFVQQKMSPPAADPVQAKMFLYMMPIMMGAFMLFLPAGLCLYILTNSALSIGQQRLIEHRLKKAELTAAPVEPETEPPDADPETDSTASSTKPISRIKKVKSGKSQRRSRSGRKKRSA